MDNKKESLKQKILVVAPHPDNEIIRSWVTKKHL